MNIKIAPAALFFILVFSFSLSAQTSYERLKDEIAGKEREIQSLSSNRANLVKIITLAEDKLAKQKEALALINREIAANLSEVNNLQSYIKEAVEKQKENSEKARLLAAFLSENSQTLTTRAFLLGRAEESVKNAELAERLNINVINAVRSYEEQEREWTAKSAELLNRNDLLKTQRTEAEKARAGYADDLAELKRRFAALKNNETAGREYLAELENRRQRLAGIAKAAGSGEGAFAKLRGKLIYPVKGRVIERYGERIHPETGLRITQYGIKIRPSGGGDILCVADGKVVYVNNLSGWQNIIIIEHDKNYFTVYGNIDEFFVRQNEEVKSGALIGRLDATITEAYLYFEIRNHRDAVDPLAWFAK
jgi:septal ring factor EnvC (AmiA/AmiB activator)